MAENSKIEWTHHTFNPWVGCTKVSPACDHCYAEGWAKRSGMVQWGAHAERRRTTESNWRQPLKWNAEAERLGVRYRVFCASLADVFDNAVPAQWRADLFRLIAETPNLDWLLLTKRIGNVASMLGDYKTVPLLPNIWIGASIVNQEEADRDIPKLLDVPAKVRFLSMEPLLGAVDLTRVVYPAFKQKDENDPYIACDTLRGHMIGPDDVGLPKLDWVIVGGESGPGARPMHTAWAQALRDQCHAAGVPFLFKQWGEWREPLAGEEFDTSLGRAAKPPAFILSETGTVHCFESAHIVNGKAVIKVGKKTAGRLLDGRLWDEVPA